MLGSGSLQPVLEARRGEEGTITGNEGPFAQLSTEVLCVRISDDLARIVAETQTLTDERIEAELLRSGHFDGTLQRRAHSDPANRAGDIIGRDRLDEHRCQSNGVAICCSLRDALDELEELRRVDDRVGDP